MLFKAELVGGSPWGFRLEDGMGEDGGAAHDRPVRIAKMNTSSKAHSKGVQVGDIVHRVNGQSVTGMSSSQVMQIVRNAGDVLTLELIRGHHFSSQGDVSSSGISSSDSLSYISHSSAVSVNHDANSSSNRSSPSSPFADKTNRLSTFGHKAVKSYRPVSFEVPTGVITSREEENTNSNAPKSLFASEFTLDKGHDHKHNLDSQKTTTFNSDSTKLRTDNSTSSVNTIDNETNLNRWNLERDRSHNSSTLVPAHPTSHSMDFGYSVPSVSAMSNTRNPSVSSLNVNLSESQSRLPVVKNPTITLLQKKRAEGQLSRSLSSFGNESSDLNSAFTPKPTSEFSSSDARQSGSAFSEDHNNAMDRLKKWKEDRLMTKGSQMEERFSQSGITVPNMTDNNYEQQRKHSISTNDSQNSSVKIFSRNNGNQSPSEASLQDGLQRHVQPSGKYTGAGVADSHADQASSERKYIKFDGIGPVDEKTGILIATRSSLDERNQKDWYKQMYKSLHKTDKDSESLYVFPGDDNDDSPSPADRTRRKSTHGVTYTIRKATPDDKNIQRYASTPSLADADPEDKSLSSSSPKTAGIRKHGISVSSVAESPKSRRSSTPSSPSKKLSDSWTPAPYKYENQPYKVQPRRIEDYEPGQSSVLQTDGHRSYSSAANVYKDEVYIKPNRRPESREDSDFRLGERPTWKSTSGLDQGSFGQTLRDSKRQKPTDETKHFNGNGDYPLAKTSSTFKTPALINRASGNKPIDNWSKDSSERNGTQISHSRQSSGYNSTSAVNSVGIHDLPPSTVQGSQNSRAAGAQTNVRSDQTHPISLAKAVYSFRAQSPSDLSFNEGDAVYIFDRIDDNWFKGECNGKVGKFPINFVERQNSAEGNNLPEMQNFGKGRALYDFKAQTALELSFKKNEELALISRVNKDWFEAGIGKQKGFVPANYVEIIKEPSLLSSPKKLLSPQEMSRPSLISTASLSTSNLTPSPAVHQNNSQRRNSEFQNDSFKDSRLALENNAYHQRGNSMGSDMQHRNPVKTPSEENKSFANQQLTNRPFQSDFRSTDHLSNDRLRPAPAFVYGPGKTSQLSTNVAIQPMQRTSDPRALDSGVAGTIGTGGTKLVSVKTATVWPTHKTSGDEKIQTANSQSFGKSRYVASFAYNPKRADELELKKGDIVYVMEQYDDGWFVGMSERTKKLGTFPGNYVEAL